MKNYPTNQEATRRNQKKKDKTKEGNSKEKESSSPNLSGSGLADKTGHMPATSESSIPSANHFPHTPSIEASSHPGKRAGEQAATENHTAESSPKMISNPILTELLIQETQHATADASTSRPPDPNLEAFHKQPTVPSKSAGEISPEDLGVAGAKPQAPSAKTRQRSSKFTDIKELMTLAAQSPADPSASSKSEPSVAPGVIETDSNSATKLVDILPANLRDYAEQAGCDPDLMTTIMLAAVSAVAGKGCILPDAGFSGDVYPNTYFLAGAPPAFGKTLGLGMVFEPVHRIEDEAIAANKKLQQNLKSRSKVVKWFQKDIECAAVRSAYSERKLLSKKFIKHEALIEELERRAAYTGRFVVSEFTARALVHELWASPANRVSLVLGDARSFLGVLSRDAAAVDSREVRQKLLECYSGDRIVSIRAGGANRRIILENPRLSMLLLAQSDAVTRFLSKSENIESGLLSRMLTFSFNENPKAPASPSEENQALWAETLRTIHSKCSNHNSPTRAETDPEAVQLIEQLVKSYRIHAVPDESDPRLQAFWTRAPEHLQKLCLLRALLEIGENSVPRVTVPMVEACDRFLRASALHVEKAWEDVSDLRASSPQAAKLRRAIESSEDGRIRLEKLNQHGLSRYEVEELVRELPEVFEIVRIQTGRPGQPPKAVALTKTDD